MDSGNPQAVQAVTAERNFSPRRRPEHRRGAQARMLRIIGGSWRGRRLRFPADGDIRPTPDRVRETLFNWLGDLVAGARCLDLFAGSGVLGLEAISRGAAQVLFVENNAAAVRELRRTLSEWGAANASVEQANALRVLDSRADVFDIAFLDPPFSAGLLAEAAARLEASGRLAPRALIYVECAARDGLPEMPREWKLLKAKRAGEVGYHLFERAAQEPSS